MKLRPTACWRIRTSPAAGAATATSSYTRASGPPTLCTRTALVMTVSPLILSWKALPAIRKPSKPPCQLARSGGLVDGASAFALGEHIEQLDGGRERDGKID